MPKKPADERPQFFLMSQGWNIAIAILVLVLLGHWMDEKFHTAYLFTAAGALLGVLYSLYEIWRMLK
ncbi:MAG: AtpZ/AtpI family protein [Candidatus Omnitrophica bacterium]|nr:AtpZ/AtpI family protein [Candidatus Omnitrophota bacterium]MDE2009707.1 AtpZ/AtpI family protein [Candidatus Omnitrophota bacterium]MDE2213896.1 AtpZ/AtpI family protein [Candidatus Omnitrophota bacterium]MDE2231845.1 AtpZ/AtpI family protein [Candidatus Omnitrophota bacterium]